MKIEVDVLVLNKGVVEILKKGEKGFKVSNFRTPPLMRLIPLLFPVNSRAQY